MWVRQWRQTENVIARQLVGATQVPTEVFSSSWWVRSCNSLSEWLTSRWVWLTRRNLLALSLFLFSFSVGTVMKRKWTYHNPAVVVSFLRRLQNNPLFCHEPCGWLKKLNPSAGATCSHPFVVSTRLTEAECGKNTNDVHVLCFSAVRALTKKAHFCSDSLTPSETF